LFAANENDGEAGRGVGKTSVVTAASLLFGGHVAAENDDNFGKLVTRLLSSGAMTKRLLFLDNVKSHRFSWASLEGMITSRYISGHVLFQGEGARVNNLTVAITANGARLSKDLSQRAVIIQLKRPQRDPTWQTRLESHIQEHRWEIIGDLVEILQGPVRPMSCFSRWANWEAEVLARASPEPHDALKVLEERRGEVDDDGEASAVVRDFIRNRLVTAGHNPDREAIFIPTAIIAGWVNEACGEKRPTNKCCSHLLGLCIREIRKTASNGRPGYCWRGEQTPTTATMVKLNQGWN
jgi:hypothetical protein